MKILREGSQEKLLEVKRFICPSCGCIFEADNTEYRIGSQYNEEFYFVDCPYCSKRVYSNK